jgi:hypothetical protein
MAGVGIEDFSLLHEPAELIDEFLGFNIDITSLNLLSFIHFACTQQPN